MPKEAQDAFSAKYGISFDPDRFDYLQAKAKQINYSESSNSWISTQLDCLRVVEKQTKLFFDCDLTSKPHAHILFLGLDDPQKPIGFFKMKKAMVIFRAWIEENDFDGAFGRSVASQYKTKLNKSRYSALGGDWRRAKANIKDNKGVRSKGLDKLSALYLRTGLWVVAPREMQKQEGLIILMPTDKIMKKMIKENPDWMAERLKFSKTNERNTNKNK